MAARFTSRVLFARKHLTFASKRNFNNIRNESKNRQINEYSKCLLIIGGGATALACANWWKTQQVHAAILTKPKPEEEKAIKLTMRERRFIKFASVEFDGQLYMTPKDFLDSVVEAEPRPRLKRLSLTANNITDMKNKTPPLKKGSKNLFRNVRHNGIITYTEYLFLLSILTKPRSGFLIAFNMFDIDGNQQVDLKEFYILRQILGGSFREQEMDDDTRKVLMHLVSTVEQARQLRIVKPTAKPEGEFDIDSSLGRKFNTKTETFLQTHFFGPKGDKVLTFKSFSNFMENLQTEILEIEFNEFGKGNEVISEMDFARILLRYTHLNTNQYEAYLERLLKRLEGVQQAGIKFKEFRDFCNFLNTLEDFEIAMNMYTMANHPISKEQFTRAIKICTGHKFSDHLIDTVFAIFDVDGDGRLSHKEFIDIMLDRLYRGMKTHSRNEGWNAFKHCVKQELLNS